MSELTVPGATSVGITRLGRSASETAAELGPLADLIGTWVGSEGWELIAVPEGEQSFDVKTRPYIEVVTFEAIGAPVPNRGGAAPDLFIAGLLYQMRIADKETNEPLHLENGMWLNLGESQEKPIVRQASIPHGDVFLALGESYTTGGAPEIPSFSALPEPGPDAPFGYTEKYPRTEENFAPSDPNKVLREAIEGLEIVNTTSLSVSTEDGGGIVNIPFVEQHAKTSQFACTYWLETIKDPKTGDEVQQLQYSQQSNIEFIPKFGEPGLIMWPHVNVNTLRKQ
ncbi:MAG: heme-binding protein [Solirubrobacterales bacterium]